MVSDDVMTLIELGITCPDSDEPVLALPDFSKPFTVMADASNKGTGTVLMQDRRPIAYTSQKFSAAEDKYTTGEKEALALVHALKQWRCYLEGTEVLLVTDHQPLVYLQTQANLSRRQARWLEFLSRFNFNIVYQRGVDNIADPLSRHPAVSVLTRGRSRLLGGEEMSKVPLSKVSKAQPASASGQCTADAATPKTAGVGSWESNMTDDDEEPCEMDTERQEQEPDQGVHLPANLFDTIRTAYHQDNAFKDTAYTKSLILKDGLWRLGHKVVVPKVDELRRQIMQACHDSPWSGHRGVLRTIELITREFWWPTLTADVTRYVLACDSCQRNNAGNQRKAGLLQPLPIPEVPWSSVSMGMIVQLPATSAGWDSILVMVDRLTKYAYFVPTTSTLTSEGMAQLFVNTVVARHGMPDTAVSDRGAQFNSQFWGAVCQQVGVRRAMSSAYHPESDGQTERMNRILEDVLRHYVAYDQKDWDRWLPMAQFAVNNSWQASVKNTPHFLNHGYHPRHPELSGKPDRLVPRAVEFLVRQASQSRVRL